MSALLIAAVVCGVEFSTLKGWRAETEAPNENKAVQCEVGLVPRHWPKPEKGRWGEPEHPMRIEIFAPKATYDEVLEEMEFYKNEQGEVGVYSFRGMFEKAEPFRVGRLRGVQATPFARGYIKDQSLLRDDESRVYSASSKMIVAKTPEGRWIGVECNYGTPDYGVDCDAAVARFARTLRFVK